MTQTKNDDDQINYLYGSQAFEAMNLLEDDQIKEYLPLANVDKEDHKEPHFVKEYKRFLKRNDLDITHLNSNYTGNFNLTEELKESKKAKWMLRQKFKLVSKLRKHYGLDAYRSTNKSVIQNSSKIPDLQSKERSRSIYEQSIEIEQNDKESATPKKIDIGLGTGPDILSMLSQLKENRNRRNGRNTTYNVTPGNHTMDYSIPNKPEFNNMAMQTNIQELDDENYDSEFTISQSK